MADDHWVLAHKAMRNLHERWLDLAAQILQKTRREGPGAFRDGAFKVSKTLDALDTLFDALQEIQRDFVRTALSLEEKETDGAKTAE